MYLVVAWQINRLMRLGRGLPELPADLLFEADEWKAPYLLNKRPLPRQVPSLNSLARLIAQVGGFLRRRGDGDLEPRRCGWACATSACSSKECALLGGVY
nr:IS4 family transposase [Xanthomonas populi]